MTIGEWMLCIILICFGLCIVGVSLITLILNTRKNETMLEMQINASKLHSTQHVETMKYEDLLKIVETITNFHITKLMTQNMKSMSSDEERSLFIDDCLPQLCVDIYTSLSESFLRGILSYVSESYFKNYIKDTTRLLLIARMNLGK